MSEQDAIYTEEPVVRTFLRVIKTRTVRTAQKVWRKVRSTAKTTASVANFVGYGIAWTASGALAVVGHLGYGVARFSGHALVYLLTLVMLAVITVITASTHVAHYVVYTAIKVMHLVALVLCTPWIALHSTEALKTDWRIFGTGLRLRNWHIISPVALAAQTMRETPKPPQAPAADDGQTPRPHTAKRVTEPKGHPTPKQHKRRPTKLGPLAAAG